jgi:hypothetical protein
MTYTETDPILKLIWELIREEEMIEQGNITATVQTIGDPVNHPSHYTSHPSGVEVIQITEHMNFCLGNAIKYILRADHKGNQIQDLKKAVWYINREIERLQQDDPSV